ncbi:hypothetical protein MPSEU_000977400 [Mayamaea pseudoterrestris]|nr:hypothetical protein MPSEU_000977400 [Mayamaea pseudoterrestris]
MILHSFPRELPLSSSPRASIAHRTTLYLSSRSSYTEMDQSTVPLVAGFSGGIVSTTLLLPLDVVKVRLQVNESTTRNGRRLGTMSVFRSIVRHEGIVGLYQGWLPAVIGSSVSWGGYFYVYERLKRSLVDYKTETHNSSIPTSQVLNSFDHFVLACSAGGIMVAITNPIWLVKTRMQLQMKKTGELHNIKPYNGMVDAIRRIVQEEGYLALYKGCGPAMLLTSHGGVQFVVYEYLRKHFHYTRAQRGVDERASSVWHRLELSLGYLLMGAAAKITASTVTYPLQVLKARMQQRSDALELTSDGNVRAVKRQYRGLTDSYRRIVKREGISGLFKGLVPNAIRVAPGAAITFVVYEGVLDWLTVNS